MHLARVKLALMPQRLQQWPHEGPVLVRERNGERVQYHVIDGWQHLGTVEQDTDVNEIDEFRRMSRHLRHHRSTSTATGSSRACCASARYRPMPLPSA